MANRLFDAFKKISARQKGQQAETLACQYLLKRKLKLVTKNYTCRGGEIDLIMRHDDTLVFIEVRARQTTRFGSASESVDRHKQDKLIKAALHYLQKNGQTTNTPTRFDVIAIQNKAKDSGSGIDLGIGADINIEWIQNAFQAA